MNNEVICLGPPGDPGGNKITEGAGDETDRPPAVVAFADKYGIVLGELSPDLLRQVDDLLAHGDAGTALDLLESGVVPLEGFSGLDVLSGNPGSGDHHGRLGFTPIPRFKSLGEP